jgi:hypothetical protein
MAPKMIPRTMAIKTCVVRLLKLIFIFVPPFLIGFVSGLFSDRG